MRKRLFRSATLTYVGYTEDCKRRLRTAERNTNVEEDRKIPYFLLGLGLGVAVGILFAPKSGEETRRLLKSKTDEGKEYVKRRTEAVLHDAEDLIERGKRTVIRQKDQFASAVEAGKQAYRESVATPQAPAPTADDLIEGV